MPKPPPRRNVKRVNDKTMRRKIKARREAKPSVPRSAEDIFFKEDCQPGECTRRALARMTPEYFREAGMDD